MQLYTKILLGMVVGVVLALLAKQLLIGLLFADQAALVEFGTRWIEPIGKLFIRSIILTVVPLVFTSIAAGMYSLGDPRELGRIGARAIAVFMCSSGLAACIATGLYLLLQPGRAISATTRDQLAAQFAEEAGKNAAAAEQAAEFFSGSPLQVLVGMVLERGANAGQAPVVLEFRVQVHPVGFERDGTGVPAGIHGPDEILADHLLPVAAPAR
jgi:Na+/H+-dicarboxylate symporter